MNPDDDVLVVLLNNRQDYERVAREHWYRIPVRHAPRFFSGAGYLAFYLSRAFGENRWSICDYAEVRGHELTKRRELMPDQPDHPRADELYYKLQLGPLERREPPIRSKRGRRILFLWTKGDKFTTAQELNDLFHKGPAQDRLWEALKGTDLDIERQMLVHEGRSRYRVDFLVYCLRGRLAVVLGNLPAGYTPGRDWRMMAIAEDELERIEHVVVRIKRQAAELGAGYSRNEA